MRPVVTSVGWTRAIVQPHGVELLDPRFGHVSQRDRPVRAGLATRPVRADGHPDHHGAGRWPGGGRVTTRVDLSPGVKHVGGRTARRRERAHPPLITAWRLRERDHQVHRRRRRSQRMRQELLEQLPYRWRSTRCHARQGEASSGRLRPLRSSSSCQTVRCSAHVRQWAANSGVSKMGLRSRSSP